MPNSRNTTPCNSSNDASDGSSPEPIWCQCENQQAHWGWDGIPHKDLPELCRRTIGNNWPGRDEKSTAGNEALEDKSASEEDPIAIESDPDREWEPEWQYCRISEGTKRVNTKKISLIAEKSGAEVTPSTNSRKRRRSDKENSDTSWTTKKCKKRESIHIKFRDGEQSRVKISVEFSI